MSYEQVDIVITDSTAQASPIEGVLVRVYSEDGKTFFTQSTTDEEGAVGFLLETQNYTLRFNKFQVSFLQPQLMTVIAGTNTFDVTGDVCDPPEATDSRLCRASGYFRDITGAAKPYLDMHFVSQFDPILLEDAAILTDKVKLRTDKNGYAQLDLIRNAKYLVVVEAMEDEPLQVTVPDLPSANLPDLLLPRVGSVVFDPVGDISVAVDEEVEITPSVYTSSGVLLEGPSTSDVRWYIADEAVASVSFTSTSLIIRGVSAGTTTLEASRQDSSIIRIPDSPISGVPLNITVT